MPYIPNTQRLDLIVMLLFWALLIWYSFDEQVSRNMREFLAENTQKLYHVSNSLFRLFLERFVQLLPLEDHFRQFFRLLDSKIVLLAAVCGHII